MLPNKIYAIALFLGGLVLFVASLLADAIGFGNAPGIGNKQIVTAFAGAILAAAGLLVKFKRS